MKARNRFIAWTVVVIVGFPLFVFFLGALFGTLLKFGMVR